MRRRDLIGRMAAGSVVLGMALLLISCGRQETGNALPEDAEPITETAKDTDEAGLRDSETAAEGVWPEAEPQPREIPELGYNGQMMDRENYACWNDMLILGDSVYRKENGRYRKSGGTVYDLFDLYRLEPHAYDAVRQCGNLLVTRKGDIFLFYDMDAGTVRQYRHAHYGGPTARVGSCWYIYDNMLFYMLVGDGDTCIWRYDPVSEEAQRFSAPADDGWEMRDVFMIRDDGTVMTEWYGPDAEAGVRFLPLNRAGQAGAALSVTRNPGETECGFEEWRAFNEEGLFVRNPGGDMTAYCLQDNGERKEIADTVSDTILTAHGCFSPDAMAVLDYMGNELAAYPQSRKQLETCEDYGLFPKHLVYDGGTITTFYEEYGTGMLRVCQEHTAQPEAALAWSNVRDWTERGADRITVSPGQVIGVIAGYTFERTERETKSGIDTVLTYVRGTDALLPADVVGNGVYVSEHVQETGMFLGEMFGGVLDGAGRVEAEQAAYFSQEALAQLQTWDWERLAEWKGRPHTYDCSRERNRLLDGGWDWLLVFHRDMTDGTTGGQEGMQPAERVVANVCVVVSTDAGGVIRGVSITPVERFAVICNDTYGDVRNRLPEQAYAVQVIRGGKPETGIVIPNFEQYWQNCGADVFEKIRKGPAGLLAAEDAAATAAEIGTILKDVLESRGGSGGFYESLFAPAGQYGFHNVQWEMLENNWKMAADYDCYYTDMTEVSDCIRFRYYCYPDFDDMNTETASAVIFDCMVNDAGQLKETSMRTFPLTEEACRAARTAGDGSVLLVSGGAATDRGREISFPAAKTVTASVPMEDYIWDGAETHGVDLKTCESLWDCSDTASLAVSLGELLLTDLNERCIADGAVRELFADDADAETVLARVNACRELAGEKWRGSEAYECREITEDFRAGTVCLRYTFYRYRPYDGKLRNLVLDVRISEQGITDIRPYMVVTGENP